MKLKFIIGGAVGIVFIVIALFSLDSSKIEYSDFKSAQNSGKIVQIIGAWEKVKPYEYDTKSNTFTFDLKDEKQNTATVIFKGSKPNNFDIAPMVVVKGKYTGGKFEASEVLTKCPSKYQSELGKQE